MQDVAAADQTTNKHGHIAPPGCRMPHNPKYPRVAVGDEVQGPYEDTFLVERYELEECLFDMVGQSWTLKAWFSYRIKAKGLKDTCDLDPKFPTWERVWELIQKQSHAWDEVHKSYKDQKLPTTRWELKEPSSTLSLLALVIVVLSYRIQANSESNQQDGPMLRWHSYYYDYEGKLFTLYRFMLYQQKLFALNRTDSIYPPSDPSRMSAWQQSWGYWIRRASEDFVRDTDWDSLNMLGESLKSQATQKRKVFTLTLTGDCEGRVFKRATKITHKNVGSDVRRTLRKLLGVNDVDLRSDFTGRPIKTLQRFRQHIDSCEDVIFQIGHSAENCNTSTSTIIEHTRQRDYSSSAILKLEPLLCALNNQDQARSAQLRFGLIRENHRHSADFVKELEQHFAPLDQVTTARWQELSDARRMCEEAMKDKTQFYKLRSMIDNLGDAQRSYAQQYFILVNGNSPLASVAAEHLIKLIMPDDVEWEQISKRKRVFDEYRKEAGQQS